MTETMDKHFIYVQYKLEHHKSLPNRKKDNDNLVFLAINKDRLFMLWSIEILIIQNKRPKWSSQPPCEENYKDFPVQEEIAS